MRKDGKPHSTTRPHAPGTQTDGRRLAVPPHLLLTPKVHALFGATRCAARRPAIYRRAKRCGGELPRFRRCIRRKIRRMRDQSRHWRHSYRGEATSAAVSSRALHTTCDACHAPVLNAPCPRRLHKRASHRRPAIRRHQTSLELSALAFVSCVHHKREYEGV